jgi:hypothetical protein
MALFLHRVRQAPPLPLTICGFESLSRTKVFDEQLSVNVKWRHAHLSRGSVTENIFRCLTQRRDSADKICEIDDPA